jgi:hypothetical protein
MDAQPNVRILADLEGWQPANFMVVRARLKLAMVIALGR